MTEKEPGVLTERLEGEKDGCTSPIKESDVVPDRKEHKNHPDRPTEKVSSSKKTVN